MNRRISRFIVSMLAVLLIGGSYSPAGPARASAAGSFRRRLEDLNLIPTLAVTNPIRIMPLGDSITAGSSSGSEDPSDYISYRKSLFDSLVSSGYSVDFVGSQIGGDNYDGFDPYHEGHPGFFDDQVAANIYSWLESNPADVILLHIGTNNLNTSTSDVENILNAIDAYENDYGTEIWVVLAKIINRSCSVNEPPCSEAATTTTFNNNVEAVALSRTGDKILIADMGDADIDYRLQAVGGDMWDNLHPFETGYVKMADVWEIALDSLLPFARSDSYIAEEDSDEILDVLSNDVGTSLVVTSVESNLPSEILTVDGGNGIHYQPAANFSGAQVITYTIEGVGGAPADRRTASVTVTVEAVNDLPTANPDSKPVLEDQVLKFQVDDPLANDSPGPADESSQTLSITGVSSTADTHGTVELSAGEITYTPDADYSGAASFAYTVCDDGSPMECETNGMVNVTVENVNDAPSFTLGPDQVVNEDSGPQVIGGWATDISAGPGEAGQNLTFEVSSDNPGLFSAQPAVNGQSGTLTYSTTGNVHGTAQVSALLKDDGGTANDGQDSSEPQTFTISVAPVNDAPSFTAGGDQAVYEDSGPQTVPGWVSDLTAGPGESGQALTFVVSNYNPGLFSNQPNIDLQTGTLTFTPAANASGTAQVIIVLKDDGGTTNSGDDSSEPQTFTITVVPVNDPPALTRPDNQQLNVGDAVSLQILASDPDNAQLTYTADNLPPGLSLDPQTGLISGTLAPGSAGAYMVDLSVSDGAAAASTRFTIHAIVSLYLPFMTR